MPSEANDFSTKAISRNPEYIMSFHLQRKMLMKKYLRNKEDVKCTLCECAVPTTVLTRVPELNFLSY